MPATDEDLLRDLMHRATGDLHARSEITTGIVTASRRRHVRGRALGIGVTGAAAAAAVGVAAVASSASGPSGPGPGHAAGPGRPGQAIQLTAAQRTLNHLSARAAAAAAPIGPWVKMTEQTGGQKKTTIVDTRNGDVWTYQPDAGQGVPPVLYDKAGMPTAAQLAAYPTSTASLRVFLIRQAKQQQARAEREMLAQARKLPKRLAHLKRITMADQPKETSNDWAFSQAAYTLWNPEISPALRAALLKVIAATPGVAVNSHARDSMGRPAVEISRYDPQAKYTEAVFEAPDATKVLETDSLEPATPAHDGLPGEKAYQLYDTYLSITWSATRPSA
ncbi:MAG TPA: hypothetical protein VHU92_29470 [Streptosporangiaceae bacterium]|jgi:hypothetical protein|nr:hypothetical protein [Streptosporangiaceae bacterium]